MNTRLPLDGKATLLMLLLCSIWGMQQIALKAAMPDMAPTLQIGLRSGVAALMVALFLRFKGMGILPGGGALPAGILAGVLFSLEYLLAGEGLRYTSASHMSVMLYTSPVFAALGLHLRIAEEKLNALQWGGIFLAFCGVAIMFFGPSDQEQAWQDILFGDFLGLLAGMSWGATTVVIRTSKLSETPSAQTVFIQLIAAFAILPFASLLLGNITVRLTPVLLTSLASQTFMVAFVSLLVWFWLLRVYLASRLGVLTFLTPVFGVIFGVVLLGETVDGKFIGGAICILLGIMLVSGWQVIKPYLTRGKSAHRR